MIRTTIIGKRFQLIVALWCLMMIGDQSAALSADRETSVSLRGTVSIDGAVPAEKRHVMTNAEHIGYFGRSVPDEQLLIGGECKGIANVLVAVDVKYRMPSAVVRPKGAKSCIVALARGNYVPHASVLNVGDRVEFVSLDGAPDLVTIEDQIGGPFVVRPFIRSDDTAIELFKPTDRPLTFSSRIYPWITGVLFIQDRYHCVVTNRSGSFEIDGLKPGLVELHLWHECFGPCSVVSSNIEFTSETPGTVRIDLTKDGVLELLVRDSD